MAGGGVCLLGRSELTCVWRSVTKRLATTLDAYPSLKWYYKEPASLDFLQVSEGEAGEEVGNGVERRALTRDSCRCMSRGCCKWIQ